MTLRSLIQGPYDEHQLSPYEIWLFQYCLDKEVTMWDNFCTEFAAYQITRLSV